MRIVTIIPALDEEAAIASVVRAISRELVHEVIVVDNGSRDGTAAVGKRIAAVQGRSGAVRVGRAAVWEGIAAVRTGSGVDLIHNVAVWMGSVPG